MGPVHQASLRDSRAAGACAQAATAANARTASDRWKRRPMGIHSAWGAAWYFQRTTFDGSRHTTFAERRRALPPGVPAPAGCDPDGGARGGREAALDPGAGAGAGRLAHGGAGGLRPAP